MAGRPFSSLSRHYFRPYLYRSNGQLAKPVRPFLPRSGRQQDVDGCFRGGVNCMSRGKMLESKWIAGERKGNRSECASRSQFDTGFLMRCGGNKAMIGNKMDVQV